MSEWGTGQVTGGKLFCRKQPIAGYEYWGRFTTTLLFRSKLIIRPGMKHTGMEMSIMLAM